MGAGKWITLGGTTTGKNGTAQAGMKTTSTRERGLTTGIQEVTTSTSRIHSCNSKPAQGLQVEEPAWRNIKDTRRHRTHEQIAVELFKLEWRQTQWRDRLEEALGGGEVRDPLISTFGLFHLCLDLLGVPTESREYCRDKWVERYGEMVRCENDIPKYVAWAFREAASEYAS